MLTDGQTRTESHNRPRGPHGPAAGRRALTRTCDGRTHAGVGMNYDHEESIYNLIPTPVEPPVKPPLYHSNHAGRVDPHDFLMGAEKRGRGTFGPPTGRSKPDSTLYLKKHSTPGLPQPMAVRQKLKTKAPVPKREEKPVMGLVSSKNFITTNAVEAILSQPTKGRHFDEKTMYTSKRDYGKVPAYLKRIQGTIQAEKAAVQEFLTMQQHNDDEPAMRLMPEEHREQLLNHLKEKWERTNSQYQQLSFTLDTPAKQKRKESYEQQLQQIEKDIQKLQSKGAIYVADDY